MEQFSRNAVGDDVQQEFMAELKQKIKQKFEYIKSENERHNEQMWINFLQQNFVQIENNLQQNVY